VREDDAGSANVARGSDPSPQGEASQGTAAVVARDVGGDTVKHFRTHDKWAEYGDRVYDSRVRGFCRAFGHGWVARIGLRSPPVYLCVRCDRRIDR
jgi:hypothetical protein